MYVCVSTVAFYLKSRTAVTGCVVCFEFENEWRGVGMIDYVSIVGELSKGKFNTIVAIQRVSI